MREELDYSIFQKFLCIFNNLKVTYGFSCILQGHALSVRRVTLYFMFYIREI